MKEKTNYEVKALNKKSKETTFTSNYEKYDIAMLVAMSRVSEKSDAYLHIVSNDKVLKSIKMTLDF